MALALPRERRTRKDKDKEWRALLSPSPEGTHFEFWSPPSPCGRGVGGEGYQRRKTVSSVFIVAVLAAASARGASSKPTAKAIADGLICQCGGCNFPVGTCNHEQCASRDDMKAMAQKEIEAGKDEAAIFQDFVLRYGVKVLATPPASGFNLSVWILPAVGGVLGLAVVILLARRWRRGRGGPDLPPGPSAKSDPALLAAIEEEMKESGITG